MYQNQLIFDMIGYKFELHNLVGKIKIIDVTDNVTFPKLIDFVSKKI